ncbi:MAG: hypothetical protein CMD68_02380 [Gammaproteobacteria bacterium]|nr:hypothetical protein [Gammaproteobacteria bacterium]
MTDYFLKYNHFSILKNYILKDPLCDWFEIHKDHSLYQKDNNSYYKEYIIKESEAYKEKVFREIKGLSKLNIPLITPEERTKELIQSDFPLILQGKLLNKDNLYVTCDIIIKYSLFRKLFSTITNLPFHLLCRKNDYLLINLTYASLHFKMDLKDVNNDGLIPYKKCSLYAFQEKFFELSGEKCHCFLMGKDYYYKKTLLPKKEFICKVSFDENIKNTYLNAVQWIQSLKNNYQTMNILPEPSHLELYPNMNYKESGWENEKIKLADKIKEITLVWNISYDERCRLVEQGIKCWDDPKLLKELKETKKKDIQERMIHMNQQKDVLIHPRKNISAGLSGILERTTFDIYFDVESFLSFDEKQNLFNDSIPLEEPVLGILGFIHQDNFYEFTIQKFTKEEEQNIVQRFADYLWKMSNGIKGINIYHWGHAEYNYFRYIHEKYPTIKFPEYKLINVLDYFRMEPIIVQGVFKFGLKSIGKALYKNNLIQTTWEENDNGLDSMLQFKDICRAHTKNIPLKRHLGIKEIIDYNRIDCQVLYEIVELLRDKYKR